MILCKLCIAKLDEKSLTDKKADYEKQVDDIEKEKISLNMRLKNLKDLNLGPSDFTFMSSLENNLEALKSNYNEFNSDLGTADKYEGALEEQSKLNAVANSSTLEGFVLEAKEIKTNINDLI